MQRKRLTITTHKTPTQDLWVVLEDFRWFFFFSSRRKSEILFLPKSNASPESFLLYILQADIESMVLKDLYQRYIRTKPHMKPTIKYLIYSGFIFLFFCIITLSDFILKKDHYKMSHWLTFVIGLLAEFNFLIMPMEVVGKYAPGFSGSLEILSFAEKLHFMRLCNNFFWILGSSGKIVDTWRDMFESHGDLKGPMTFLLWHCTVLQS